MRVLNLALVAVIASVVLAGCRERPEPPPTTVTSGQHVSNFVPAPPVFAMVAPWSYEGQQVAESWRDPGVKFFGSAPVKVPTQKKPDRRKWINKVRVKPDAPRRTSAKRNARPAVKRVAAPRDTIEIFGIEL